MLKIKMIIKPTFDIGAASGFAFLYPALKTSMKANEPKKLLMNTFQ